MSAPAVTQADADPPQLLDEAVVGELESLDRDLLTNLLSMYFDRSAGEISAIGGAIGRGEMISVAQAAHKIRGSSVTLGAVRVALILADLEASAKAADLTAAHALLDTLHGAFGDTREAFRSRAAGIPISG
jgi:HPt (histidine-containing phosphotransfer) domain-containing protein